MSKVDFKLEGPISKVETTGANIGILIQFLSKGLKTMGRHIQGEERSMSQVQKRAKINTIQEELIYHKMRFFFSMYTIL